MTVEEVAEAVVMACVWAVVFGIFAAIAWGVWDMLR